MAEVFIQSNGVTETDIYLNSVLQGQIDPFNQIDVNLKDSLGNSVTPISSNLTGNTLDITTYGAPSGVSLQFPTPSQYTSYITGDVGWRWQNAWFSGFVQPSNPAKIAELDFSQPGQNGWFVLKNALTVGGVSNTIRFVDVTGVQTFSAVNNKNLVVIDKLTGMMITRTNGASVSSQWADIIDGAFNGSITVEGVTYSDWYLISINEIQQIFGNRANGGFVDSATGVTVATVSSGYTADTRSDDTTRALQIITGGSGFYWLSQSKTGGGGGYRIWVRNAQNLIS
jgi:hypothetical protein